MLETVSASLLPLVIALVGGWMLFGRRDFFSVFVEGAREGLRTAVGLLPTLSALLVSVAMLRASGLPELLSSVLSPLTERLGVPSELLSFLLVRPFSGGASNAAFAELLEEVGADSFAGLCASVIFGSTDTLVYVVSVYSSAAGLRSARGTLPMAVLLFLFCIFFSCFLCRIRFF